MLRPVLASLVLSAPVIPAAVWGAGLHLVEGEFNFGLVPPASVVAYHLRCTAEDGDTVHVSAIKTGCGCIVASADSLTLIPGDTAEIPLKWEMRHLRGKQEKTVYLFTTGSDDPYKFSMQALVAYKDSSASPLAIVQPQDIRLGRSMTGPPLPFTASLRNTSDESLEASLASNSDERLQVEIPESLDAKSAGQITFGWAGGMIEENWSGSITLLVSGEETQTRITIPVTIASSTGSGLTNKIK